MREFSVFDGVLAIILALGCSLSVPIYWSLFGARVVAFVSAIVLGTTDWDG
ncbi:MAG TPA: hypothetical protein VNT99_17620 [Methylomirabilota bacterium]|nr:hypothetical protein [Methylomirabilota bacterium]